MNEQSDFDTRSGPDPARRDERSAVLHGQREASRHCFGGNVVATVSDESGLTGRVATGFEAASHSNPTHSDSSGRIPIRHPHVSPLRRRAFRPSGLLVGSAEGHRGNTVATATAADSLCDMPGPPEEHAFRSDVASVIVRESGPAVRGGW